MEGMKMTIESTDVVVPDMGRIWNGVSEKGVRCQVIVMGIISETDADRDALKPELDTIVGFGECTIAQITTRSDSGEN